MALTTWGEVKQHFKHVEYITSIPYLVGAVGAIGATWLLNTSIITSGIIGGVSTVTALIIDDILKQRDVNKDLKQTTDKAKALSIDPDVKEAIQELQYQNLKFKKDDIKINASTLVMLNNLLQGTGGVALMAGNVLQGLAAQKQADDAADNTLDTLSKGLITGGLVLAGAAHLCIAPKLNLRTKEQALILGNLQVVQHTIEETKAKKQAKMEIIDAIITEIGDTDPALAERINALRPN